MKPVFLRFLLARRALQWGGGAPTILNAANEAAVEAFVEREIGFPSIVNVVEESLTEALESGVDFPSSLDEVLALDAEGRRLAKRRIKKRGRA